MSRRLVVAAFCGLLLASAAPGGAQAAPALEITGVKTTPGKVGFTASVSGLPSGVELDQADLSVRVAGRELPVDVSLEEAASPAPESSPASGPAQVRGVVVAIDTSGSMEKGDAIGAARSAATEYVKMLPADVELGLVGFGARASTLVAPTTDRETFVDALRTIKPDGDTALYDGVRQAISALNDAGIDRRSSRRIVVLSDGEDTASETSLGQLTKSLDAERIPVDVVALGSGIDRALLRQLTEISDGRYLAADDTAALASAFREAAQSFTARLLVSAEVPEDLAGRRAVLDVVVTVAGQKLSASHELTFAAVRAAAPPRAVRLPAMPTWLSWVVAGLVFAALFVAIAALLHPALVGAPRRRRIQQVDWYAAGRPPHAVQDAPSAVARTALALTERAVQARGEERMVHKLDRAGMSVRPGEWLLLQVCAVITAVALMWLLLPWWAGIPLGLLLGCVGTVSYRVIRTKWRIKQFNEQLPDALQLVIGSLRSGFSLAQALAAVVRESADPLSTEIGRALAETRIGSELEDALSRVVARTDSQDLAWAVMSIRIQREVGGNLAEVLQTAVDTMRERGRLRRHVKALSAEGRLSAYILIALPIGIFGFLYLIRREYIESLYTTGLGIFMLVVAGLLVTLGGFWMSRLVKVEV